MKIYMLWDMEGCSGLFTKEQAWYWDPGVDEQTKEYALGLLMADVNSATQAALDAGATEVIVCDTHHGGGNIRIPKMNADPRITYHGRSRAPAPEGQRGRLMPGLDESVDLFMTPATTRRPRPPTPSCPTRPTSTGWTSASTARASARSD